MLRKYECERRCGVPGYLARSTMGSSQPMQACRDQCSGMCQTYSSGRQEVWQLRTGSHHHSSSCSHLSSHSSCLFGAFLICQAVSWINRFGRGSCSSLILCSGKAMPWADKGPLWKMCSYDNHVSCLNAYLRVKESQSSLSHLLLLL